MGDHFSILVFLTTAKRHLERVADQGLTHMSCQLPADNPSGVHVENDGEVTPPFLRADVGEVSQPQLIRAVRGEVAMDKIGRRHWRGARDCRATCLAFSHPFDAMLAHQSFHGAASHANSLTLELLPGLPLPVDLERLSVNAADLTENNCITNGPCRRRLSSPRPVRTGRHLKLPTNRLDPETSAMLIDECAHLGRGWSSSRAKTRSPPSESR